VRAASRAWRTRCADGEPARLHRHRPHALGHPRRATTLNAHPHFSGPRNAAKGADRAGAQRHHRELRGTARKLIAAGYVFDSQTDTEVIAHLVDQLYEGDLSSGAARGARAAGAYAIAVFSARNRTACRRASSPLVVGWAQ